MLRLIIALFFFVLSLPSFSQSYIPRLDGTWKIVDAKFAPISAMDGNGAKQHYGKKVQIDKGYFDSPFATCKFCGLEKGYKIYSVADFLKLEPDYKVLDIPGKFVAVNELKFEKGPVRQISIVTVSDNKTAYLLWDGVFFVLKYQ